MKKGAFQHRSGRVIGLGRLVLATVFLIAIWLDPSQPNQQPGVAYGLLSAYVLWSALVLGLTWRNWWLQSRMAPVEHVVDIAAFGILVFFTEGYTSPFYTFFVFLILSAAIRWSWRETALTAAAVLLIFFAAGLAALAVAEAEFDLQRLLVRFTHLIVLSLLFIWFGVNEQGGGDERQAPSWEPGEVENPPVQLALRLAAERMNARRVLFLWSQKEEPWLNLTWLDGDIVRSERAGPEDFGSIFSDPADGLPFLFDAARGRGLSRHPRDPRRPRRFRQAIDPDLASRHGLDEGIVLRIRAQDYEGDLFALGIDGLCADDLKTAEALGREISALFDRSSMVAVSEEAAVARARMSLARDLHDSVVQILAGAAFRLEALKSWIKAGRDPAPEIDNVKADLAVEQRNVRSFIAALRGGRGSVQRTDLGAGLPPLAEQLRRRWDLELELAGGPEKILGPVWIEHELHQIIREAAANAVRHGQATALSIALRQEDSEIALDIGDNGSGFPAGGAEPAGESTSPWSVHERVKGLGGTLSLVSGAQGTQLHIRVPLEGAA